MKLLEHLGMVLYKSFDIGHNIISYIFKNLFGFESDLSIAIVLGAIMAVVIIRSIVKDYLEEALKKTEDQKVATMKNFTVIETASLIFLAFFAFNIESCWKLFPIAIIACIMLTSNDESKESDDTRSKPETN